MSSIWKNYNAKLSYDGYFTDENKLRKHAKIISSILEKYGNKKLQEIEKNCQNEAPRARSFVTSFIGCGAFDAAGAGARAMRLASS